MSGTALCFKSSTLELSFLEYTSDLSLAVRVFIYNPHLEALRGLLLCRNQDCWGRSGIQVTCRSRIAEQVAFKGCYDGRSCIFIKL